MGRPTAVLFALPLVLCLAAPPAALAQPPAQVVDRCAARARIDSRPPGDLPQLLTVGTDGRDAIVAPLGQPWLHRIAPCSSRWQRVRLPGAHAEERTLVSMRGAVMVWSPNDVFVYRNGRARRVAGAVPQPVTHAAHGNSLLVASAAGTGLLDVRRARWTALPGAPAFAPGRPLVAAMDAARAYVIGEPSAELDRAAGAWRVIAQAPLLAYAYAVAVDGGLVIVGREGPSSRFAAYRYDSAADRWAPLPTPPASDVPDAIWREGPLLVVELLRGGALLFDLAASTWRAVAGLAIGGQRPPGEPRVRVGTQHPTAPRPGEYPAMTVDPIAARWRHADLAQLPQQSQRAIAGGRLVVIEPPRTIPGGWVSLGCDGPREPGMPACDPMRAPTTSAAEPARAYSLHLAWQ